MYINFKKIGAMSSTDQQVMPSEVERIGNEAIVKITPPKSATTIWHTYTRDDAGNKIEVEVNQPPAPY